MKLLLFPVNIQVTLPIQPLVISSINLLVILVSQQLFYGAISTPSNINNHKSSSFSSNHDTNSQAGSTSLENTGHSEMMGLAVFKDDALVGELSAGETMCHLVIQNDLESCVLTIPNPEDEKAYIDLYLYNRSKPKIKVKLVNDSPLISIDLKLTAKILSSDENAQYVQEEQLSAISVSANNYLKNMICDYLYRTTLELGSDIDGFGRYALSLFNTTQEFKDYNWLDNYCNSFFDVNVDIDVQSALLLSGK